MRWDGVILEDSAGDDDDEELELHLRLPQGGFTDTLRLRASSDGLGARRTSSNEMADDVPFCSSTSVASPHRVAAQLSVEVNEVDAILICMHVFGEGRG